MLYYGNIERYQCWEDCKGCKGCKIRLSSFKGIKVARGAEMAKRVAKVAKSQFQHSKISKFGLGERGGGWGESIN